MNDAQVTLWNGPRGRCWADQLELVGRLYKPFEDMLVDAVCAKPRTCVLDIGCGGGGTTLAIARALGRNGRAVGIDISEPMLSAARARAEREGTPATFIRADAQTHAFDAATVDMLVSRFGVMFFEDPTGAFQNLRRAATGAAELQFIAWRGPAENPFMTTAERAAAPILPDLPPRVPHAPGQFAFADAGRVQTILQNAGWTRIELQPIDVACTLPEKELVPYLTSFGPVGTALQDADDTTRRQVMGAIRPAFDPYVHGDEVQFTAACWMVKAAAAE